tara:strand:+ start:849 stop:1037 length:189 start_codon:yes stop_codon:yes gene_type:complete
MTCAIHQELEKELEEAKKEIQRLKEENESLWFMLDEIKESDKMVMKKVTEAILLDATPDAEA